MLPCLADYKALTAFEVAARRCRRLGELAELYAEHAPEERRLYGRLKGLEGAIRHEEEG